MDGRDKIEQKAEGKGIGSRINDVMEINYQLEKLNKISQEFYHDSVKNLTAFLKNPSTDKKFSEKEIKLQKEILKTLKKLDERYVTDVLKGKNAKTILFTRHGHSSDSKKKAGLNPNAEIGRKAKEAMKITDQITSGLLDDSSDKNRIRIVVSPMLRALQTAALIIPHHFKGTVSTQAYVTEKSSAASGKDIRSKKDLEQMGGVMGTAANLFYGHRVDNIISERDKAIQAIQSKSLKGNFPQADQDMTLSDEAKLIKIKDSIESIPPGGTLWNICHGKISSEFFLAEYGPAIKDLSSEDKKNFSFDFGETKKILYFEDEQGKERAFLPSYTLIINQETGFFKPHYLTKGYVCEVQQSKPSNSAVLTTSMATTATSTTSTPTTINTQTRKRRTGGLTKRAMKNNTDGIEINSSFGRSSESSKRSSSRSTTEESFSEENISEAKRSSREEKAPEKDTPNKNTL